MQKLSIPPQALSLYLELHLLVLTKSSIIPRTDETLNPHQLLTSAES